MKRIILAVFCMFTIFMAGAVDMNARKERRYIKEGNEAYRDKDYQQALSCYNNALKITPSNIIAIFNRGLATTRIAESLPDGKAKEKEEMFAQASKDFESVARHTSDNPQLAAKSLYNRGNISMMKAAKSPAQDAVKHYEEAIDFYKRALRLNPADDLSRRNLRIAQQNLPKSNQNQNNQNKNKDQDKDKNQDKEKDKNKDKDSNKDRKNNSDKDQNKDKDRDNRQTPQQKKQDMNSQNADRILKRSSDKENQTRRKFTIGNPNSGRSKGW